MMVAEMIKILLFYTLFWVGVIWLIFKILDLISWLNYKFFGTTTTLVADLHETTYVTRSNLTGDIVRIVKSPNYSYLISQAERNIRSINSENRTNEQM